ncbi:MAG: hypothetical protein ACRDMV_09040 [Streptosporangiales bacterium]
MSVAPRVRRRAGRALAVAVAAALAMIFAPASLAAAAEPPQQQADQALQEVASGGGFVNSSIDEAGSYAFAVESDGTEYVVTARHVAPIGALVYGPGGLLGQATATSIVRDASYVRLNDAVPDSRIRIGTSPHGKALTAKSVGVAPRGSIDMGQRVCHSGYADTTQDAGGYVCGTVVGVPDTCETYHPYRACRIAIERDDGQRVGWLGDSGGPVWEPVGDGKVRVLGVFTAVSVPDAQSSDRGYFVPAYDILDDLGGDPVSGAA